VAVAPRAANDAGAVNDAEATNAAVATVAAGATNVAGATNASGATNAASLAANPWHRLLLAIGAADVVAAIMWRMHAEGTVAPDPVSADIAAFAATSWRWSAARSISA